MKTIVDGCLSEEFLLLMGRYTQTCAHIEKLSWLTLCILNKVNFNNDKELYELISKRKQTRSLIEALKESSSGASNNIKTRIYSFLDQVEAGLENRHIAIHGAWSLSDEPRAFSVDYFINLSDDKKKPKWGAYHASKFSMDYLLDILKLADDVLSNIVMIYNDLIEETNKSDPEYIKSIAPSTST